MPCGLRGRERREEPRQHRLRRCPARCPGPRSARAAGCGRSRRGAAATRRRSRASTCGAGRPATASSAFRTRFRTTCVSFSSSPMQRRQRGVVALDERDPVGAGDAAREHRARRPATSWTSTGAVWSAAGRARSSSSRTSPSTRFASRAITVRVLARRPLRLAREQLRRALQAGERVLDLVGEAGRERLEVEGALRGARDAQHEHRADAGGAVEERARLDGDGDARILRAREVDRLALLRRRATRSASTASCAPPGSARTGSSTARSRLRPKSSSAAGFRCTTPPSAPTTTTASAMESRAARASAAGSGGALPVRDKGSPRPTALPRRARRCGCG